MLTPPTQATTTAQHTLRLDTFEGEAYEGALLYVTLSVNNFAYQSVEEVDPIDAWALLGSAGGMWGEQRLNSELFSLDPIVSGRDQDTRLFLPKKGGAFAQPEDICRECLFCEYFSRTNLFSKRPCAGTRLGDWIM